MPLRRSTSQALAGAVLTAALMMGGPAPAAGSAASIGDAEIRAAAERAAKDKDLGHEYQTRVLRWNTAERAKPAAKLKDNWFQRFMRWLGDFSSAAAGGARWVLIVAGCIAAAFLGAYLWRLGLRRRQGRQSSGRADAPTHIRGLDIRPERLPDDIGAAALATWNAGEHRAALLLLYRAALSRLVHRFDVPIRDSSTEGECLRLAEPRLGEAPRCYVSALIGTWSRASYAALPPGAEEFAALCRDFELSLDAPVVDAAAAPPAAAPAAAVAGA